VTWADLGSHAQTYLALAACALLLGALAGIALGVLAAYTAALRTLVLALTNIGRAVPSLALLTFMIPVLGLGFAPALAALAILATAPIAITTDVAFRGVPVAAIDAARGLGMSPRQEFWRVQLPLAAPVLIGGIRLTTVALIAIATLGGYVGAGGLGNDIFQGLQRQFLAQTLAGSIPAAALAVIADGILRLLERRMRALTI